MGVIILALVTLSFKTVKYIDCLNTKNVPHNSGYLVVVKIQESQLKQVAVKQDVTALTQLEKTIAFESQSKTSKELYLKKTKLVKTLRYTENDLDLLARVINAEAGSSWLTEEHKLLVGNVVLNRVTSQKFPNTIKDVIYAKGQYACTVNGMIKKKPTDEFYGYAKRLLEGEQFCPENVVFQAEFKQGKGVYKKILNTHTKKYTYFCY